MTLNELKQKEKELNEKHDSLMKEKELLFQNKENIGTVLFVCEVLIIFDRITSINDKKIECLKAQVKLLTN